MPVYKIKPGGMHEQFFRSRKKVQVIGGGFGNGKTAASCVKGITLARDYPGSKGLIGMATYKQLNDTIRTEFLKWVPSSAVSKMPTVTDNTLIFKNGSVVNFRYLQQKGKSAADGQTSSNLLSATYDWAIIDQIEDPRITHKDFLDLLGRLRGSAVYRGTDKTMPATGPRWLILAANPSYNWVYHELIEPLKRFKESGYIAENLMADPETGEPMIDLFEGSTYENEHNLEKDFIRTLEAAYKGQFRKRFLEGEWAAFEGLVYPQFDPGKHLIASEDIMRYLYSCRAKGIKLEGLCGLDYGIAEPTCFLLGCSDPWGRIFVVDGFYQREMTIQQIGDRINMLFEKYYPYIDLSMPILADPAIFRRTVNLGIGKGAHTIARLLQDNYPFTLRPAQNDILTGIAKVAAYLSIEDFPHPLKRSFNGPLIFFNNALPFIVTEFGSYFWKQGAGLERIDEPIDRNDHAMDTLKYMLSYVPDAHDMLFRRPFQPQQVVA